MKSVYIDLCGRFIIINTHRSFGLLHFRSGRKREQQIAISASYKKCPVANSDKNHSTQDSRVVPHRGTNWAALRLTAQIGRDAVLSKSYGRG